MSAVFDKSLAVCALLLGPAAMAHAQVAERAPATAASPAERPQPTAAPVFEGTAAATGELRSDSPHSWFWRPPLTGSVGEGDERWTLTLYGFVQGDFIVDTTRSYDDAIGPTLVARSDTYAGQTARSQLSVRNSRLGLMFTAPSIAGIRSSAVVEADFLAATHKHQAQSGARSRHSSTTRLFVCGMPIFRRRPSTSTSWWATRTRSSASKTIFRHVRSHTSACPINCSRVRRSCERRARLV